MQLYVNKAMCATLCQDTSGDSTQCFSPEAPPGQVNLASPGCNLKHVCNVGGMSAMLVAWLGFFLVQHSSASELAGLKPLPPTNKDLTSKVPSSGRRNAKKKVRHVLVEGILSSVPRWGDDA